MTVILSWPAVPTEPKNMKNPPCGVMPSFFRHQGTSRWSAMTWWTRIICWCALLTWSSPTLCCATPGKSCSTRTSKVATRPRSPQALISDVLATIPAILSVGAVHTETYSTESSFQMFLYSATMFWGLENARVQLLNPGSGVSSFEKAIATVDITGPFTGACYRWQLWLLELGHSKTATNCNKNTYINVCIYI